MPPVIYFILATEYDDSRQPEYACICCPSCQSQPRERWRGSISIM